MVPRTVRFQSTRNGETNDDNACSGMLKEARGSSEQQPTACTSCLRQLLVQHQP